MGQLTVQYWRTREYSTDYRMITFTPTDDRSIYGGQARPGQTRRTNDNDDDDESKHSLAYVCILLSEDRLARRWIESSRVEIQMVLRWPAAGVAPCACVVGLVFAYMILQCVKCISPPRLFLLFFFSSPSAVAPFESAQVWVIRLHRNAQVWVNRGIRPSLSHTHSRWGWVELSWV